MLLLSVVLRSWGFSVYVKIVLDVAPGLFACFCFVLCGAGCSLVREPHCTAAWGTLSPEQAAGNAVPLFGNQSNVSWLSPKLSTDHVG